MIKGLRPFNWAILILIVCLIQDRRYSEIKIELPYNLPKISQLI